MISETITIPKTISDAEDRFVVKLKENLLRMIKEINRNGKKIDKINNEHEDPDYTDEFNSKANVDASNIGYGDLFEEKKNDEGEVIYSVDDNREDWGNALTNKDNNIASDNVTLVSSQNVYNETHPYMDKDGEGKWINPYHYINYKNLRDHEGAEDINKQDRWSEQDFFQPHEPNDNMVKENLIALDTAIYEVSQELDEKANISLNNLNQDGLTKINDIALGSVYVRDRSELGEQDPLVKVAHQRVKDQQTGLYTDVYTVYSDATVPSGGIDLDRLYKETRGYLTGAFPLDYGGEENQHYRHASPNACYVDSGYFNNTFNKKISVAKNISNLNKGLLDIIGKVQGLRNILFGNIDGYKIGNQSGSQVLLEWTDDSQPEKAYFQIEGDGVTQQKTIEIYKEVSGGEDVSLPFDSLKFSGKVELIKPLLDVVLDHEKYKDEHTTQFSNLSRDIYGTPQPPVTPYQNIITGQQSNLVSDINNINTDIYNTTNGILKRLSDLEQRVTALESRI